MKNSFILARKDFFGYLNSWVGVLVVTLFFILGGVFFYLFLASYAKLSVTASQNLYKGVEGLNLTRFVFGSFFVNFGAVLIFFVPLLSMKAFAEERKYQTLELLFTYPFSDFEIVWGKFLGMVWFFELMLLPTLLYLGVTIWLGGRLDWGPILTGYLGFWLLGNAYLSLGLFVSSLAENPIVSGIVTFGALILFWLLDWAAGIADGTLAQTLTVLSPLAHFREFSLGILDIQHIAYFCFFHLYFLFLTLRSIERRNWKG